MSTSILGLSDGLVRRCREIFERCIEFEGNEKLKAVFIIDSLIPFQAKLPEGSSKSDRVNKLLDFLQSKRTSTGRLALPLFIEELSSRYEGDYLQVELKQLAMEVEAYLDRRGLSEEIRVEERFTSNLFEPPIRLIDRQMEARHLRQWVVREGVRWVTLTGPGGVGKSHLAQHAAHDLIKDFKEVDGAFHVDLGEISDAEQVIPAIARAVGLREEKAEPLFTSLSGYLRGKQVLLLLDNFDRVAPAVEMVARLLAEAPRLEVWVTSRQPSNVRAEKRYSLKPLDLPDLKGKPALKRIEKNPSVELFVFYAQNIDSTFTLTKENFQAVAEICARLDGLPLAIKLAASQVDTSSPQDILAKLEPMLPLLTGGSKDDPQWHQTMQRAIDWSYNLLDQDAQGEKLLFRRLAVFAGSFSEKTVKAVCDPYHDLPIDVFTGIRSLFHKSLIQKTPVDPGASEHRYEMLHLIREYALNRLSESGEARMIERHYAQYFLDLAEEAESRLRSEERSQWFARLEIEHRNLLGVLESLDKNGEVETSLQLAGALFWFWNLRNYWSEGRRYLERSLQRAQARGPAAYRAKALYAAGGLAWLQGDYKIARSRLDESAALWRELGDRRGLGYTLIISGLVFLDDGRQIQKARETLEEGVKVFREVEDRWGLALTLSDLGNVLATDRKFDEARTLFEQSLNLFEEVGDPWGIGLALDRLGFVAYHLGDIETAQESLERALITQRKVGDKGAIMHTLQNLGDVLRYQQLYRKAKSVFHDCLSLCLELGNKRRTAWALHHLGYVYQHEHNYNQAAKYFRDSTAIYQELGERLGIAECLVGLAGLARAQGELERSACLLGAADAAINAPVKPRLGSQADRAEYDRNIAGLQSELEEDRFTSAWSSGRSFTLEQALRYANVDRMDDQH